MHPTTAALAAHLREVDTLAEGALDALEQLAPAFSSLSREVISAQDDLAAARRKETHPELAGRLEMIGQRGLAIQRTTTELQQLVARLHDMVREHRLVIDEFFTTAERLAAGDEKKA